MRRGNFLGILGCAMATWPFYPPVRSSPTRHAAGPQCSSLSRKIAESRLSSNFSPKARKIGAKA